MFTKLSLKVLAISLSPEITFPTSEEISGSLKVFPFSTGVIFVCKFAFSEKRGFTFLQKACFIVVTSRILRSVIGLFSFHVRLT